MGCGLTGEAVCPRAGLEVEGFESLSEQQLPPNSLLKGKSYSCVILQRSLGVLSGNLTSGLWSMKQVSMSVSKRKGGKEVRWRRREGGEVEKEGRR